MNILDADIPAFVPEEPKMALANDILRDIIKGGYKIRQKTARGRRRATNQGMVKALAHRMADIPKIKTIEKRDGKRPKKYYYREV